VDRLAFSDFLNWLGETLRPHYMPPNVLGGHDMVHVEGVLRLGERIFPHMPEVVPDEYRAAAWLHNLDRCLSLKDSVRKSGGAAGFALELLRRSPFSADSRARIIDAVLQHSKKDDDLENDSLLLTALRIADKLDRLTPMNVLAGAAHRSDLPHYDAETPFDYRRNKPNHLKYLLWNFEWYGMLPYDWARELVDPDFFRLFLSFLRELGRDISERHGIPNEIEAEIQSALGVYYERWRP